MPTFIGIGAQKCASTWLFEILRDHPEVLLSNPKELDFFSYRYDYGLQWYSHHFSPPAATKAIGEISPSYFHEPAVPERVRRVLPEARILLSLRDPVQRALSNHKHEVRLGRFRGRDISFEAGLQNNASYLEQGLYATHLSRWLKCFPREQLLVVLYDDIVANPAAIARQTYQFLGVDSDHSPAALHERANPSYVNRYPTLDRLRNEFKQYLRRMGLESVWRIAADSRLKQIYERINRQACEDAIPPVAAETLTALRADFASEIAKLEELLGRELPTWR